MKLTDKYRTLRIPTKARFPVNPDLVERQRKAKAGLGGREPIPLNRTMRAVK